jgi:hypothetical protein
MYTSLSGWWLSLAEPGAGCCAHACPALSSTQQGPSCGHEEGVVVHTAFSGACVASLTREEINALI